MLRKKKSYENLKYISRQRSATFFQYKDIMNENRNEVKKELRELIIQLIADNKVELFYFTGETQIDRLAHEVVSEIRLKAPNIKRVYVSTRRWDDTTCAWDRTNMSKYFEERVRIEHADFIDKKYQHINFKLQLTEWCSYIVYYAKLGRLESFFNLNKRFYREDRAFRNIIETCPRKLIKLIDYDLENLIIYKNRYKLKPIKTPTLRDKIRAMRYPRPAICKTWIVKKENIRLIERQPEYVPKNPTKKAIRVRKKPFNRRKEIKCAKELEKARLKDMGKRFDAQVQASKPLVEDFLKNKPMYQEKSRIYLEQQEKELGDRFDNQIKIRKPIHDILRVSYNEYVKKIYEEEEQRQILMGKQFDKQVRAYRKRHKKSDD